MDSTIINVALPSIQRGLGASFSTIQWLLSGYTLSFALLLINGGRFGDVFGYRRLFLLGVGGFTVASVVCGLAWTPSVLVAARVLQGMAAALMVPQVMSLVQIMYPPQERLGVLSVFGLLAGTAAVLGPVVAGVITGANIGGLGWRPIFLLNIPVGCLGLIAGGAMLPGGRATHPIKVDVLGTFLLSGAMFGLVFPIVEGPTFGWSDGMLALMLSSLPLFGIFVVYARRRMRRDGSALVVPELFADRGFAVSLLVTALFSVAVCGYLLILSVTLQRGFGYSMFMTGMAHVPFAAGAALTMATASRRMALNLGRYVVSLGMLLTALGVGGLEVGLALHPLVAPGPAAIVPSLLVAGVGLGLTVATLPAFALANVNIQHAGSASGVINTAQQFGNAVGPALVGAVFVEALRSSGGLVGAVDYQAGFRVGSRLVIVLLIVSFGLTLVMPRHVASRKHGLAE